MIKYWKCKYLGFSLVEILLAMTVVAIIILAAGRYYTVTRENARISATISMIDNIVHANLAWREGQPGNVPTFTELTNAGLLPQNYSPTAYDPWRGVIDLAGSSTVITITLHKIPPAACSELVLKISTTSGTAGISTLCTNDGGGNQKFQISYTVN
jgi:prepilin-type N-terminal cleavage/methylation domain-containing protein